MDRSPTKRDTLASRLVKPIVACGAAITLLGALYLASESRRTIVDQARQSARSIAYQVGQDRAKYIERMTTQDADPTFLHEIGMSESGKGLYRVRLIGLWPVNPEHAARDAFEKQAMAKIRTNPAFDASHVHDVKGQPTFTYLRPEIAVSTLCVDCHTGNLAGTPNEVALNHPIGALEVEIPLGPALAEARGNTARAIALLALFVGAAVFAILAMLRRLVERPVAALLPQVEPLASGDFSHPVDGRAVAEIGRIARAVEDTRVRVAGVLGELSRAVDHVEGASGDVSERVTTLSAGSRQQAASLAETAASLQTMTGTVRANAEHAQRANELAASTRDQAQQGGAALREAAASMGALTAASHRIAEISGTIDEIAFQTNLLALNAAVEAARAGEQGRSFAVVAAEVRALAQRSAVASREIKDVVTDAIARVDESNVRVTRAGETLGGIVGEVRQVAALVDEIAGASADQARGIEQVSRAVEQMEHVTREAAGQTVDLDRTARGLAEQAVELRRQVGRFRLSDVQEPRERVVEMRPSAAGDEEWRATGTERAA